MPTYEYQCKNCNHRFEVWQKMVDEPLTVCPECNGSIRRLFFPAGIVFKGSGFYKTDHCNGSTLGENNASDAGKKESAATPKTENKSESTTTKTETTSSTSSEPTSTNKVSAAAD